MKLTRAKLEELVGDLIERSIKLVEETLREAGFKPSDIEQVVLVGGQTRMPAMEEAVKKFFGKEPHKGINPEEVVAAGAAVQAGIFQGDMGRDVLLLDVTPLTLSIETLGGVATAMIPKNTTIPTAKTQIFSTAADNQTAVEIHVLQGEREMAADNKTLARFILDGIPPAPRGIPQIEVTFDIDANGILNVSAKDKATSKSQTIRIEATTALNKEEVERLKQEAALHAEEDRKKKELVEAKNQAESLIYLAEKTLRENSDKISQDLKDSLTLKIEKLKSVKESNSVEEIQSATNELSQTLQDIGKGLYNK